MGKLRPKISYNLSLHQSEVGHTVHDIHSHEKELLAGLVIVQGVKGIDFSTNQSGWPCGLTSRGLEFPFWEEEVIQPYVVQMSNWP